MKISMIRGDIHSINFTVYGSNGQPTELSFDNIFFTVKKNFNISTASFQKRLSDGSISYDSENQKYSFTIEPEDTDDLKYGDYVWDIELLIDGQLKQTTTGNFEILPEVTFRGNED